MELKKTGVILDDNHKYWLGEKQLSGITDMIKRQVFGNPLANVPKKVLDARAEFGNVFHEEMELYIRTGIEGVSDTFRIFKENYGDIEFTHSEYIVTDYEHFASPIDAIDKDVIIYDFKTPTKKDIPYWEWQLGVYRYFFYIVNGFEPKGYRVIWINKDSKHGLFDINPVSMERVKRLIDAELAGEQFVDIPDETKSEDNTGSKEIEPNYSDEQLAITDDKLNQIYDIEERIIKLENDTKAAKAMKEKLCAGLMRVFKDKGMRSFRTDRLEIKVKDAYKRSSFDSKRFKEEHADMYDNYMKETTVSESLTIKIL